MLIDSAEIIPIEPDAGNADAGKLILRTIPTASFWQEAKNLSENVPVFTKVEVYKCKYWKIMKVMINNKETEIQAKTVKELAQELDLPATGCAVAISNEMVPRDEWENHLIQEGADIVIVKAFCGG